MEQVETIKTSSVEKAMEHIHGIKYGYARIWCISLNLVNMIEAILNILQPYSEKALIVHRTYLAVNLILALLLLFTFKEKNKKLITIILGVLLVRNAAKLLDLKDEKNIVGEINRLI